MIAIAITNNLNPEAIGAYPKLIKRCGYMIVLILVIVTSAAVCGIVRDALNVNKRKFWKNLDKRFQMWYNGIVNKKGTKTETEEMQ